MWNAEGGLDPLMSEDSVGALVARSVVRRDRFQGLVDVKNSVRQGYQALPPLPRRPGTQQHIRDGSKNQPERR